MRKPPITPLTRQLGRQRQPALSWAVESAAMPQTVSSYSLLPQMCFVKLWTTQHGKCFMVSRSTEQLTMSNLSLWSFREYNAVSLKGRELVRNSLVSLGYAAVSAWILVLLPSLVFVHP